MKASNNEGNIQKFLLVCWSTKYYIGVRSGCENFHLKMPRRRGIDAGRVNEEQVNGHGETPRRGIVLRPKEKEATQAVLDYLDYFKNIMKVNQWSDEEAGSIFCALLGPNDRSVSSLSDEWTTFSELEFLLRKKEEPMRDSNLLSLMKITMKEFESVEALRDRIVRLVSLTYSNFSKDHQNQLSRDFILNALPTKVMMEVLAAKPRTLDDTVSIAKSSMLVSDSVEKGNVAAFEFRNSKFQKKNARNTKPGSEIRCYSCQGIGHISRECPSKKKLASVEENENSENF